MTLFVKYGLVWVWWIPISWCCTMCKICGNMHATTKEIPCVEWMQTIFTIGPHSYVARFAIFWMNKHFTDYKICTAKQMHFESECPIFVSLGSIQRHIFGICLCVRTVSYVCAEHSASVCYVVMLVKWWSSVNRHAQVTDDSDFIPWNVYQTTSPSHSLKPHLS